LTRPEQRLEVISIDWNTVHEVENGTVEGLILNPEERAWLQACWRPAIS